MNISIRHKILIYAITPLLIFTIIISAFFLYNRNLNIQENSDARSQEIAVQAGNMAEFYLYTGDVNEISRIANQILKFSGIEYISFLDKDRNIIVTNTNEDFDTPSQIFEHKVTSKSVLFSDFEGIDAEEETELLGYVQLSAAKKSVFSKKNNELISIIGIAAGLFLLMAFFSHLFSRKLATALDSIITTTKSIEKKDFHDRCPENGTGEILLLQQTLNQMAESIEQNEIKLKDEIEQATSSLNNTVDELYEKNKELSSLRQETIQLERSKAITEERGRIMRDMHDGIGGQLVSALSILEQVPEENRSHSTIEILTHTLGDLRLIILSLGESTNYLDTLLAEFKYRVQKRLTELGITLIWDVNLTSSIETRIQPQESLHILRILQEVFTNIIKHSEANQVTLSLIQCPENTEIIISDNGNFTSLEQGEVEHGNGLKNIHNRIKQIDSKVEFKANQPSGLIVHLTLNLESQRS